MQFGNGVEDGQLFQLGHGNYLVLAVTVAIGGRYDLRVCDRRRQVRHMDLWAAGKGAGALQTVVQFADVPRPVIGQHDLDSLVGENLFLGRSTRASFHKVGQEKRDILATLAQRRNPQTENVQTEIKVAAEGSLRERPFAAAVG